jgi:hypothetical protein
MSPNRVEERIAALEQGLIRQLDRLPGVFLAFVVAGFLEIFFLCDSLWSGIPVYPGANLTAIFDVKPALNYIFLTGLGLGLLPFFRKHAWFASAAVTAVVSLAIHTQSDWCSRVLAFAFPLWMALTCVLDLAWKRSKLSRRQVLLISLFVFLCAGVGMSVRVMGPLSAWHFWANHPEYYLFFLLSYFSQIKEEADPVLLVTPAHLIFPPTFYFPFPADCRAASPKETYVSGLVKLFKFFFLSLVLLAVSHLPISSIHSLNFALFAYLSIAISSMMLGEVCAGSAEICGVKVPPATYFLPLARSPRDFFRRQTTYGYAYSFKFIFLTLLRWTKSPRIAKIFFFLAFPFFRYGTEPLIQGGRSLVFGAAKVWCLWFAALIVSESTYLRRYFNRDKWLSVFLTHLLMFMPWLVFWIFRL